jgi:hypothetical protein
MKNHFPVLILIARPAAGKSEIIDYVKNAAVDDRLSRFHIGNFEEIDDFPMLWTWLEEDEILEEMGLPRLHTNSNGYFLSINLWNLLIRRICLEYHKKLRDTAELHASTTIIIEFSRGIEHGGYEEAFKHISEDILDRAAVLYIDVSYEESLRKNRRRFNPDRPDSILEHGLSDEKLEKLYKGTDWEQLSGTDPDFITIRGRQIPYSVMNNEDDVTTERGERLGTRLEEALNRLWKSYGDL